MNKAPIIFLESIRQQNKIKNILPKQSIPQKTTSNNNAWLYHTCNRNPQDPIA